LSVFHVLRGLLRGMAAVRVVLFLTIASAPACAEEVIVFGDDTFAPFLLVRDGKPAGSLVKLLQRAEALSGDHYVVKLMPWERAYQMASSGQGAIIGLSDTHERRKLFDYSDAIEGESTRIVVLKRRAFAFNTLEDLRGKTFGAAFGVSFGDQVDQAIQEGLFSVERTIGRASRIKKVLAGRIDGAFVTGPTPSLNELAEDDPMLASRIDELTFLPKPLRHDLFYLAFAKSMHQSAAIGRFNHALRVLREATQSVPASRR